MGLRDGRRRVVLLAGLLVGASLTGPSRAAAAVPRWQIAFDSNRAGSFDIYVTKADGSRVVRLTFGPTDDEIVDWSPDGSRIAFVHLPDGMNGRAAIICTVNADGTALHRLR